MQVDHTIDGQGSMRGTATSRPLSILIADDEALLAMATAMTLEDRGHNVVTAADGTQALRAAMSDGPFDVLVTDVKMPSMDGRALVRHLHGLQPALPVVVVTGFASDQIRAEFAAIGGCVLVMQKPVDFEHLADEVERIAEVALARPGDVPG
jgi:CheY-like chemotaxis protein